MKWIAVFLVSSSWVLAGPLEDLASPSQQVRDEAAAELRKTFVLPSRKAWDELVASIKPGDTRASVMERLKPLNAKPAGAAAGGGRTTESYRLDSAWVLWIASANDPRKTGDEATTVTKIWLDEQLEEIWTDPPNGFSGTWTTYYINGQRSDEVHYRDGRQSGELTAFRPDGSKACVQHYGPGGADGEDIGYFPSGRISYRGLYKDGKQVGIWTHYNEDGSVKSTKNFAEQGK